MGTDPCMLPKIHQDNQMVMKESESVVELAWEVPESALGDYTIVAGSLAQQLHES